MRRIPVIAPGDRLRPGQGTQPSGDRGISIGVEGQLDDPSRPIPRLHGERRPLGRRQDHTSPGDERAGGDLPERVCGETGQLAHRSQSSHGGRAARRERDQLGRQGPRDRPEVRSAGDDEGAAEAHEVAQRMDLLRTQSGGLEMGHHDREQSAQIDRSPGKAGVVEPRRPGGQVADADRPELLLQRVRVRKQPQQVAPVSVDRHRARHEIPQLIEYLRVGVGARGIERDRPLMTRVELQAYLVRRVGRRRAARTAQGGRGRQAACLDDARRGGQETWPVDEQDLAGDRLALVPAAVADRDQVGHPGAASGLRDGHVDRSVLGIDQRWALTGGAKSEGPEGEARQDDADEHDSEVPDPHLDW